MDPAVKIWTETLRMAGVCRLESACSLDHKPRRGIMTSRGGVHVAWGMVAVPLLLMVLTVVLVVLLVNR